MCCFWTLRMSFRDQEYATMISLILFCCPKHQTILFVLYFIFVSIKKCNEQQHENAKMVLIDILWKKGHLGHFGSFCNLLHKTRCDGDASWVAKKRLLTHLFSHISILRGLKASLWHKSSKIAGSFSKRWQNQHRTLTTSHPRCPAPTITMRKSEYRHDYAVLESFYYF
jgi:hypothetical protein